MSLIGAQCTSRMCVYVHSVTVIRGSAASPVVFNPSNGSISSGRAEKKKTEKENRKKRKISTTVRSLHEFSQGVYSHEGLLAPRSSHFVQQQNEPDRLDLDLFKIALAPGATPHQC
jgi:hypothetical protein